MTDSVWPSPPPTLPVREEPFEPGTSVALRSVYPFGRVGVAPGFTTAARVVSDSDELTVLATTPDSDMRSRAGRGAGPNGRVVPHDEWDGRYLEKTWFGEGVVRVHRHGRPWSVWRWHDGSDWVGDWYGNLESPWRRTGIGFDTQDWTLDVVAAGTVGAEDWHVWYKDEDELAWALESGVITAEKSERIRDAGERLVALARAGDGEFAVDWAPLVPDPEWPAIPLPDRWDAV